MTSKDLIEYRNNQQWRKAEILFYEQQKDTINRITSVLSDMPKGSRKVQDNEAESLTRLLDQIDILKKEIETDAIEKEKEIKEQLKLLDEKHGLLLYHHYIIGNSIKYIAKEIIHNEKKYTYKLRDKALEEFDKLDKKEKKKVESRKQSVI